MSQWFNQFYAAIAQSPLSHWLETLPAQLKHWQLEASHGDLPQWQKDLNWIWISDEGTPDQVVWRIPKPFEIGWLFGSLPERIADWIYNEDREAFTKSTFDFAYDFGKSFGPIPEFLRPFLEDAQNENFFFERPIYSVLEKKPFQECYYNLNFPQQKGVLHITYLPLDDNLFEHTEEARRLAFNHDVIADAIIEQVYINDENIVKVQLENDLKKDSFLYAWLCSRKSHVTFCGFYLSVKMSFASYFNNDSH